MKNNKPDIWGAGSIFAFSGLDGENTFENSLVGYLKSDYIGVIFNCTSTIELAFDIKDARKIDFKLMASDYYGIARECPCLCRLRILCTSLVKNQVSLESNTVFCTARLYIPDNRENVPSPPDPTARALFQSVR